MAVTTVSVYGKPLSEPRAKIKTRVHSRRHVISVSHLFSVAALVFAAIGLPQLSSLHASTFGLLFAGVGGYLIAAAVLSGIAAFMIALFQRRFVSGWIALFVTMAVFRLPTIFASYLPMYGWTYKHIGVVDYIQTHGNVATNVDIYFAWPGLFAAVAWFCDLTGLSPTTLSLFFIPAIHIAQALAVYALARSLRSPKIVALTAAFVAEILNWIGQDYFSPQAIGFVMATATLALLFSSRRNVAYAWLSILPFFALAITHQLTPYWVCLVVFFGCALKLIRPRYMFLIYGGIALLWMILHSYALGRYGLFNGINVLSNAERPSYGVMIAGRHLTETMMKGVAAFTWVSAASIIAVRFFRRGRKRVRLTRVWLPLIITFSSFILLGGQNYGGEAIFRVLLYSLPGASIIIAGGLVALTTWVTKHNWRNMLRVLVAFPLALLIGSASLQAQYGTFFPNVIDRSAYTAFNSIMKDYPAGSYTLAFSPAGPGRMSGDYVEWATKNPMYDASLMDFNDMYFLQKTFKNKAQENQVTELAQSLNKPVVLTWTKEMSRQAAYYGLYPDGAFSNLIGWLEKDDRWRVVLKKSDIIVFELKGSVP